MQYSDAVECVRTNFKSWDPDTSACHLILANDNYGCWQMRGEYLSVCSEVFYENILRMRVCVCRCVFRCAFGVIKFPALGIRTHQKECRPWTIPVPSMHSTLTGSVAADRIAINSSVHQVVRPSKVHLKHTAAHIVAILARSCDWAE